MAIPAVDVVEAARESFRDARLAEPAGEPAAAAPEHVAPWGDDRLVAVLPTHDAVAEAALAELYGRYSRAVYGLTRRIVGDGGAAEDLLQETFWRLWERAEQYQPGRVRFGTWLLRIAANLSASELRRARRRPFAAFTGRRVPSTTASQHAFEPAIPPSDDPADPSADVPEVVWLTERRRLIVAALRRLPAEQRQVVELAYFGGMTHAQIAAAQGAPLSTVKTRLALGLRKLAGFLAGEGLGDAMASAVARER